MPLRIILGILFDLALDNQKNHEDIETNPLKRDTFSFQYPLN